MYQAMKRHSLLSVLPRMIAALALAILLLALTLGSVAQLIAGPQVLTANAQPGDYVTVDMSQLISPYAARSNSNGKGNAETNYILNLGNGVYMSLHADGKYDSKLERATDQAYDYYRNNSGILNPMGMISGELAVLQDAAKDMMLEWATESSLEGFENADAPTGTILMLDLQLNHIGGLSFTWVWILFILGLACLIWFAVELGIVITGYYYRQVQQTLGSNAAALQEWESAEVFGNARIGKDYIWYTRGPRTEVFSFRTVVWVYKQFDSRVLGKYKWPVSIFTNDQGYHELCVREDAQRDRLIEILHEHGGCFVTGYSQDNYDQFCKDFKAFCARAAANDPDAGAPIIKLPDQQ